MKCSASSDFFCNAGINDAFESVLEVFKRAREDDQVDVEEELDKVFGVVVLSVDEAVHSANENSHDDCYSSDYVYEELLPEAINELTAEDLSEELRDDVLDEFGSFKCPSCIRGKIRLEALAMVCSGCRRTFLLEETL